MGKKVVLGIFLALSALHSLAQTDGKQTSRGSDERSLREVNVTAKRRLSDTGIEKTVLDTTILRQNLSYSMADILQRNSTLFIKSYGRATESTAEFRGTSPSHTQVLWNGIKINSPILGTVDFSYIPSYFVDQATLLHGASGINLTGGGLGGAIDLSTQPLFSKGWSVQLTQGVGSFHTYDEFIRLAFSNERWSTSTRVSYGRSQNDFHYTNRDKMVDVKDENGLIVNSYHPREKNKSGYFDDINVMQEVAYKAGRGNTIGVSAWYGWSLRGLPFLSVDYKQDNTFQNEHKQQTLYSQLYWNHQAEKWSLNMKAGYTNQNINYDYTTTRTGTREIITDTRSRQQSGLLLASFNYLPNEKWMLTISSNTTYQHVRSNDHSPFHIGENFNNGRIEESLAASLKWRPVQRLSFSALVREELYGKKMLSPIPALFADLILWQKANLVLKGSVARNYRYPTLGDLYFKPGGNPSLKPERGLTYDVGLESSTKGKHYGLTVSATAFDSYISDWILWTPNNKGYWVPSNVRKVHNYGIEGSLRGEYEPHRDWQLSVRSNIAWTPSINRGEPLNDNDASYGKQLVYVPRFSANVAASVAWRGYTLTYNWMHYSERYTTSSGDSQFITGHLLPYFMNDLQFEKSFRIRVIDLSLKLAVNNLLNNQYVTVLSRPMAGRNYEAFVTVRY